jgi:tRNA-splicing ligase RtcB (3'-phosphate/5'-hydroxy nucleic acid ligase)
MSVELTRLAEAVYEVPVSAREGMRVPARLIADAKLLQAIERDRSVEQLLNVATLPGVHGQVVGMPDMHEGYGFPVGGVAATRWPDGVISPGGIGFDINCGVRLLASQLPVAQVRGALEAFVHELSRAVPTGFGRHGRLVLTDAQLDQVLAEGCEYLVGTLGHGVPEDLERLESGGRLWGADPAKVSVRAKERGRDQLGTLGGGNHFIEVQEVEAVLEPEAALALGLFEGQLTVLIHTGSRGLGHQVCTDFVRAMDATADLAGFELPDRQLACAPLSSALGQDYFAAMAAAANFAWSNRQLLTQRVRECAARVLAPWGDPSLAVVYDVAHNIAKLEEHDGVRLCVHRKGATRAFGPGNPELPLRYRAVGQPVFIPGSMGTRSFVLVGRAEAGALSFGSCCHGAGRALSRHEAKRRVQGSELRRSLEAQGIAVRCPSNAELAEEAPEAYKDVEHVVEVVAKAQIATRVVRLRPWGVLKG